MKTMYYLFLLLFISCHPDGKPGAFSADGYHIKKNKVWYKSNYAGMPRIEEVAGADPATFREKTLTNPQGEPVTYAMDAHAVYWGAVAMDGADPGTFEYLGHGYARDRQYAYYMQHRISASAAKLRYLRGSFAADEQSVYLAGEVFSDDAAHFRFLADNSDYVADSHQCWYDIYALKGVDPAEVKLLAPNYLTNGRQVYFEMNVIEGADPVTFVVDDPVNGKSHDARRRYIKDRAEETSSQTHH